MTETNIATLKPGEANRILVAKVYRKWISKSVPDMRELAFCCILIDKEGDAIQANMDIHNIEHFNPRLKLGAAYRISRARATVSKSSLRICLIQSAWVKSSLPRQNFKDGLSGSNSGNIVEFTMWDDLATQFQKKMIEQLKPPVIIAVTSCKVSRFNDFQLAATLVTHYYINHVIPEADQTRDAYNFKCIVTYGTADAQFTFFTPAGDKVTGYPCSELAHKYKEADPRDIPIEILNTKGRKHIFQIRFSSSTRKGPTDFIVDDVLDKPDKPTISQSTSSSGKKAPGTPPHDVLDTVAETFVTTIATDKNQTSTSLTVPEKQPTAKRPLLPKVSSAIKKKKGD
ncbi:nucleic acid-binding, OB-fold protein [Tanacetum coccineum]